MPANEVLNILSAQKLCNFAKLLSSYVLEDFFCVFKTYIDVFKTYSGVFKTYNAIFKTYNAVFKRYSGVFKTYNAIFKRYIDVFKTYNAIFKTYNGVFKTYNAIFKTSFSFSTTAPTAISFQITNDAERLEERSARRSVGTRLKPIYFINRVRCNKWVSNEA